MSSPPAYGSSAKPSGPHRAGLAPLLPTSTQNKPMLGVVEGDGDTRLESLNRNCCPELIATVPVDRIGITIRTLPDILPVNFALVGEKIVFRIIPGTKLDAAAAGAVVEFEVDSYSPDGTSGWSVLVRGPCSEITDPAELAAMEAVRLRAWAFSKEPGTRGPAGSGEDRLAPSIVNA